MNNKCISLHLHLLFCSVPLLHAVVSNERTLPFICLGGFGSKGSEEAASRPVCLSKTLKDLVLQHPVFSCLSLKNMWWFDLGQAL